MASKDVWNFKCPQFVDFTTDNFDTIGDADDVFFGHTKSPGLRDDKGVYAKIKASSTTDLPAKSAFPIVSNITDSQKCAIRFKKSSRLSKSEGHLPYLDKIKLKSCSELNLPKKGIPESTGKWVNKRTNPTTPMCLRRTMFNTKKPLKSSEEMELEKIAELQKKMQQHLRFNEMSLKRSKMRSETTAPVADTKRRNNQFTKPFVKSGPSYAKDIADSHTLSKKADLFKRTCDKKPVIRASASQAKKKPETQSSSLQPIKTRKTLFKDFVISTGDPLGANSKVLKSTNEQGFVNMNNFHSGLKFCTNKNLPGVKAVQKKDCAATSAARLDNLKTKNAQQISASTSKFGKENVVCR